MEWLATLYPLIFVNQDTGHDLRCVACEWWKTFVAGGKTYKQDEITKCLLSSIIGIVENQTGSSRAHLKPCSRLHDILTVNW